MYYALLLILAAVTAFFSRSLWGKAGVLFLLLVPCLSLLACLPVRRRLSVSFSVPAQASKNTPAEGRITLRNGSFFGCRKALVSFSARNDLTGETAPFSVILPVPSRGNASAAFSFTPPRNGMLTFSAGGIKLFDWFGLFRIPVRLSGTGSTLVLPDTFPAKLYASPSFSENTGTDNDRPRGQEDPSETRSFREYRPGDPVKRIHWKLSAKRRTPLLREISRPAERTLLLFWEKAPAEFSPLSEAGPAAEETDALAETFSSAALSLAAQGIPFTMGWHDAGGERFEMITGEDAVLEAVPQSVRYGAGSEDLAGTLSPAGSGTARHPSGIPPLSPAAENTIAGYAKVLWFSASYPSGAEAFLPDRTLCFLCGSTPRGAGRLQSILFAPDEAQSVFAGVRV